MTTSFRDATIDDLAILEELEQICFPDPWNVAMILSEILMPDSFYKLLFEDEKVIGYCCYSHVLDEVHIMNIAVRPDCRGKGFGNLLVEKIISEGKNLKANAITLEARESNLVARKLYEKYGFKLAGVRPRYYMDGENAVIYWLYLEE